MKISKWNIFYYFLKFRYARLFRSNRPSRSILRRWKMNLQKSSFYKNYLNHSQAFPLMNKQKFMEAFDEINTVGIKKKDAFELAIKSEVSRDFSPMINEVSIGLSSGTSGNKGIFLTSKKEKAIWVAAVLDRVIGLSFRKRKVAFFLRANNNLYESVKSGLLSFRFFDLKTKVSDQFENLEKLQADILVAQPSVLYELARLYEQKKIKASYRKIISVAEVLEEDQKHYFQKIFNCEIQQVYQCTEGFLAYTCKKGKLHFNEDWLKIEKKYLDDSKTRFHPVITDYLRSSQPVIQYELNDIIHEGTACTCGSKAMVIDRIEGRSDDVFSFDANGEKVLIYPDFIRRAVLSASEEVSNFIISRTAKNIIEVSLEVQEEPRLDSAYKKVHQSLLELLNAFKIKDINIIQTVYKHHTFNKFKRIRNEY